MVDHEHLRHLKHINYMSFKSVSYTDADIIYFALWCIYAASIIFTKNLFLLVHLLE